MSQISRDDVAHLARLARLALTDAGVRPLDVDDKKTSLEDQLRDGFMAAYESRVGEPALAGE